MIAAVFGLVGAVVVALVPLLSKVNYILFEDGGSPLKIIADILF